MHCIEVYKVSPFTVASDTDLSGAEFDELVTNKIQPAIDEYANKYNLPRLGRGWKIVEDQSADESDIIIDDVKEEQSVYTVKVFLDQEFVGGEIEFFHRGVLITPVPGDILIYPSSYINSYRVKPITSGSQRYLFNKYRFPGTEEG